MNMSRFALNDLSHQKNLHLQTPISHHKLCNSAQQNKQMINQSMSYNNISEKASCKTSQSQQIQLLQQQDNKMSQQLQSQQSQQSSVNSNSSSKETPFFTNSIKNVVSINMFGQPSLSQFGKENIFSASQPLQQTEIPEQKFGGSYQIFEVIQINLENKIYQQGQNNLNKQSMIEEGIKDIQQLFNQNEVVNKDQQRRGAFAGYNDIQRLEQAILEGQTSDYDIYVDNKQQKNYLNIPVPVDLFDQESAIKKSLSALNEDYLNINQFQFLDDDDGLDNDPAEGFFDLTQNSTPTKGYKENLFF